MRELVLILFQLFGGQDAGQGRLGEQSAISPFPRAELIEIVRPRPTTDAEVLDIARPESQEYHNYGQNGKETETIENKVAGNQDEKSIDAPEHQQAVSIASSGDQQIFDFPALEGGAANAVAVDITETVDVPVARTFEHEVDEHAIDYGHDNNHAEEQRQVDEIRSLFAEYGQTRNRFEFGMDAGIQRDYFQWNIASDITGKATPNILSELTWRKLNIAEIRARANFEHSSGFSLEGKAGYGRILSGENQDSDYFGDNRTFEFSRSNNNGGDDGIARSGSIALGWKLIGNEQEDSWVSLLIGYAKHDLNLLMTDGKQTVPALGRFPGLHSSYHATWQGPWAGIEFADEGLEYLHGKFRLEYHFPKYYAWANWNLRPEFRHPKSFEHEADGKGVIASLDLYSPRERGPWSYKAGIEYQYWRTESGADRTFFNDFPVIETRLNVVKRRSWGASFGLEYQFGAPHSQAGVYLAAGEYLTAEDEEVEEIKKLFLGRPAENRLEFGLDAALRRDFFRWNIGFDKGYPDSYPDVLSELTWRKLNIAEIRARANFEHSSGFSLEGKAGYGRILSGENQDSDYLGDGRTLEFSRSHADTDGNTRSQSVALGWRLAGNDHGNAWWTGLVGYSRHEMHLTDTRGKQVIPVSQPFSGLHSTYDSKWQGPWIGLQFTDEETEDVNGRLRLEYHWARYYGWANWNLRTDFQHPKSFEHEADGKGYILSLDLYSPPEQGPWSYQIGLEYQRWKTDAGIDRTFFSNSTVGEIDLNEVKWQSWGLNFGLEYKF